MINILGIGLDYLMLKKDKVRGDVVARQFKYAKQIDSLTMVTYSPKKLAIQQQKWGDNILIYPTNSSSKAVFFFDAFRIAFQICRKRKFDVITTEDPFSTGLAGFLLRKIFKIPLNVQVHIDFVDNKLWLKLRRINLLLNIVGKFICKHADTVRVDGREIKEKLVKCGIADAKIQVISVHSDFTRFKNLDGSMIRAKFRKEGFEQILLFVGRLADQKDIPSLFSAFELILKRKPKTLLLLLGEGPKRESLYQLAQEKSIISNVKFMGAIDHAVISQYYAASDIFVLPSVCEGRATVLIEAMLAKKPIVSTHVSGSRDWVIENETGYVVPTKDLSALAEKVIYLLENSDLAKSFGEKGYQLAQSKLGEISDVGAMIRLWEQTASL